MTFDKSGGPLSVSWHNCREMFHSYHKEGEPFLIQMVPGHTQKAIEYVRAFEARLGLAPHQRAEFWKTQSKDLVWVFPEWWGDKLRSQVLTILLRTGHCPDMDPAKPDVSDAAQANLNIQRSVQYYRRTRGAIDYFAQGHTQRVLTSHFGGWVNEMGDKAAPATLAKVLRRPEAVAQAADQVFELMLEHIGPSRASGT